jgi:hypothetical protein
MAREHLCLVTHNAQTEELIIRAIVQGNNVEIGRKLVNLETLESACNEYWGFVNDSIKAGHLTSGPARLRAFYDELKTRGAVLCRTVLDPPCKLQLWILAAQSDVLVVVTSLLHVPWEALFNPDPNPGSYLSDHCVIARFPEKTGEITWDLSTGDGNFTRDRIICLDRVLADSEEESEHINTFRTEEVDNIYLTALKGDLVEQVKHAQLIHWICEHAEAGLRLDHNVFYSWDDTDVYRFPCGAILVLTSCQSGSSTDAEASIAAGICAASRCTVIAPSSVVATRVGVALARRMIALLKEIPSGYLVPLYEYWAKLKKGSLKDSASDEITPEMCFVLWYGIYGRVDAHIRRNDV